MQRSDLIEEIARVAELSQKDAKIVLEAILDSIVRALRTGDRVEIRGFGSFTTHVRKARKGTNPRTGSQLEVNTKRVPTFKVGAELKTLLNRACGGDVD